MIFALFYGRLLHTETKAPAQAAHIQKSVTPAHTTSHHGAYAFSFSETLTHVAAEAAGRQVRYRIGCVLRDAEIARRKEESREQNSTR